VKLAYCVVARDSSGVTLKEFLRTIVKSKAVTKLEELRSSKRTRKVDGVEVADYKIIPEPV